MTLRNGLMVRKDDNKGTTPVEGRLALAGLFSSTGILKGGTVAGTSGWAYSVGWFNAASQRSASDGVVLFANDSTTIVGTSGEGSTIPPAPSTGTRIDVIYALHRDVDNADPDSQPVFGVASGTASGSPTAPTIPVGAVEIARATVGAGATNTAHANVTITTASAPKARLLGTGHSLYAMKGTGATHTMSNAQYDWIGTLEPWTLVGPASAPPEFTYRSSDGTNQGVGILAAVAGLYRISTSVHFEANSTGSRYLRIVKNGSTIKQNRWPAAPTGSTTCNLDAVAYLNAGDRLGIQAYQDSGGPLALSNSNGSRQVVMEYLGP